MMAWDGLSVYGKYEPRSEALYDDLVAKTLIDLARADGLISTQTGLCTEAFERRLHLYHPGYLAKRGLTDIVDWPAGSFASDGQGRNVTAMSSQPINTVVNAFYYTLHWC